MKIYVVETIGDYCYQLGYSTSKAVAEKKAKEYHEASKSRCTKEYFVTEYTLGKDNWCKFE